MFSGIGGFRMGLERLGMECTGYSEINKHSKKSYEAIFDTKGEIDFGDITKVTNEEFKKLKGGYELLVGGFPCQAFSIAGNRRGFEDTRGTLFFELARILEQTKPPLFLFENVKGLLSHNKGKTFETILSILDGLGYCIEWKLLNSKDFGTPQSRERVYIVGYPRGTGGRGILFNRGTNGKSPNNIKRAGIYHGSNRHTTRRIYSVSGTSHTIVTRCDISGTPKYLLNNGRVRILTPRETWRLQGFPDWAFGKAKEAGVSEPQLYKQAGNSVTVNVVEFIGERILEKYKYIESRKL